MNSLEAISPGTQICFILIILITIINFDTHFDINGGIVKSVHKILCDTNAINKKGTHGNVTYFWQQLRMAASEATEAGRLKKCILICQREITL